MSVNSLHLAIFGRTNTGKSSLVNMLTGQNISIVSDQKGTTTDPVKKSVEITGLGPAILIDTAGIDDLGEIGFMKIKKSLEVIKRVDCAILLIAGNQFGDYEVQLINKFKEFDLPYLIVHNKNDLDKIGTNTKNAIKLHTDANIIDISTFEPKDKEFLIDSLKGVVPETVHQERGLIGDLIKPNETVLLIVEIDSGAPEGRLILPQNQTIRDIIKNNAIAMVIKESELDQFLKLGICPSLAITDSQIFETVTEKLPETIPLTSFSILFARLKGDLKTYIKGTSHISNLQDGDNILLLESCTHHSSCDDIGRVKIPNLLQKYCDKKLNFTTISGLTELPPNITDFALVIQCGGCMATRKQITNRLRPFIKADIPVTNYGMVLAFLNNSFERVTRIFRES